MADKTQTPRITISNPPGSSAGLKITLIFLSLTALAAAGSALLFWQEGQEAQRTLQEVDSALQDANRVNAGLVVELENMQASLQSVQGRDTLVYFMKREGENNILAALNPNTQEEVAIFTQTSADIRLDIYAQPRTSDSTLIFLERTDTDPNTVTPLAFDLANGEQLIPVSFHEQLPTRRATALSFDETRLASVYSTDSGDRSGSVTIWHLLDGSETVIGTLNEGEFFQDGNGAEHLSWKDGHCVEAQIFTDQDGTRTRIETRTFCQD